MGDFISSLTAKLSKRGIAINKFYNDSSLVEKRVMSEYGAIFLNSDMSVVMPSRCIFADEAEVTAFQARAKISKQTVGSRAVELQQPAMDALMKALDEAGKDAKVTTASTNPARRSFAAVQTSWNNAVSAGANYWTGKANKDKKVFTAADAKALKSLTGVAQIKRVFELEDEGYSFHPERNRSVAVYTAIPGASQHLLMLALDIDDKGSQKTRAALGANGWFQTVYRDRPHYTYLGLKPNELVSNGLVMKKFGPKEFWVPKI